MHRKEEKHGKSAKNGVWRPYLIFYFKNKVMCTAINKALKVCKFQLPTIGVNEPNLRKTLIKCTKWCLTAMLDFKLKK